MASQAERNQRWKDYLRSDRAILIACVLLALFFWLLIKLSKRFTTTIEYGIHYNLPEGKTFRTYPPQTIIAQINGQGWDLIANFFNSTQSHIVLNLDENERQSFYQSQLKAKLAKGLDSKKIQILDVNHEVIHVDLDNELVKKVPIRFDGNLGFRPSYALVDSVRLVPDSVAITGPLEFLDTVQFWKTNYTEIEDLEKPFAQKLTLYKKSSQNISLNPAEVELQLQVEQFTEKSVFVPISIINEVDSLRVFPESVKLNFMVALSQFNAVNSTDFVVEVDAQKIAQSQSTTVALDLKSQPSGLRHIKMNPKSAEFFFLKKQEESTENSPDNTEQSRVLR